jgi:hypothetical protein
MPIGAPHTFDKILQKYFRFNNTPSKERMTYENGDVESLDTHFELSRTMFRVDVEGTSWNLYNVQVIAGKRIK